MALFLNIMESLQNHKLCVRCSRVDLSPLTAPLPVSQESHRDPATVYEEQLAVYIPDFRLDYAKRNSQCRLCNLLAVCAHRSGEEHTLDRKAVCIRPKLVWLADARHASHEGASGAGVSGRHNPQTTQGLSFLNRFRRTVKAPSHSTTRLCRTGQLHVWFHEIKSYPKGDQIPKTLSPSEQKWDPAARIKNAFERRKHVTDGGQGPSDKDANPRRSGENRKENRGIVSFKSAVASWMLDIVQHDTELSDCGRVPISHTTNTTMIRNWLIKCDEEHSHLPGPGSSVPRILHIIGLRLLRVINTSTGDIKTLSVLTNFVALSYVWGREREPDQSLKALPIMDYAATIRDAATLAQSLGFDWLWVDRICIDQSNDNEKAVLIPYIKDIFASATLTLVAASGNGAHFGLPGSPHTAREGEKPLKLDPQMEIGGDILQLLAEQPSFNTLLNDSVWRTRGWTFEEEVFSRRLLYIFPTEIFFSCNKGTYRESTVNKFVPEPAGSTWADFGATPPLITAELNAVMQQRGSSSSSKLFSTRQFVRAVEEYTSRDLTIEEDRVEAFAGLVTAATLLGDKNLEESLLKHGHPFEFFETALTWHPETDTPKRSPAHGKPFVPSWSWASAGSKVRFLDSGEEENKSNWFQYGSIENQDILGLPSSENLLSTRLGLDFPTQLIASRPWLEQVSFESPPSYLEVIATPAIATPAIATPAVISLRSSVLPTLHLVSVVFEAKFTQSSEGQHSLRPVTGPQVCVKGHWAIISPDVSEIGKFVIVAGNANICIMALKQEPPKNTFSRIGLLRMSWYGVTPLFCIMRQGHARWEYLRLI